MKYAILFSGQGAQRPNMGVDLMADSLFSDTIDQASSATGLDLLTVMKSKNGELKQTVNVQPAIVAMSVGIYRMLKRDLPNLPIVGMVGLSLGEYSALMASSAIDFESGMKLLADRAKYMQADADREPSTMAAVLNPKVDGLVKLLKQMNDDGERVYPANFNSPRQLVIGGSAESVTKAAQLIKDQGLGKKAVLLKVSGAFHTPFFNTARDKMHDRLQKVSFNDPQVTVMSNTTSQPFKADNISSILERQLAVPTHFDACLKALIDQYGADHTLEIGPGKTLTSFARQIDRHLDRSRIGSLKDYQQFVSEVANGTEK